MDHSPLKRYGGECGSKLLEIYFYENQLHHHHHRRRHHHHHCHHDRQVKDVRVPEQLQRAMAAEAEAAREARAKVITFGLMMMMMVMMMVVVMMVVVVVMMMMTLIVVMMTRQLEMLGPTYFSFLRTQL